MSKSVSVSELESVTSEGDDDEPSGIGGRDRDTLRGLCSQGGQVRFLAIARSSTNETKQDLEPREISELYNTDRKLSHAVSAAEKNANLRSGNLTARSEVVASGDLEHRPQIVRKLSGEIVRPALRTAPRRPSIMPVTPTPPRSVHFNSQIEHIRYIPQSDGDDDPLVASPGSPTATNERSDDQFPSPGNGQEESHLPSEWELVTINFPHHLHHRKTIPVMLETVWLSNDQQSLLGSAAAANVAFHKHVACRFTLDYWETVSEIRAEYSHESSLWQTPTGYDCFTFAIKLSDIVNLESKTLLLCIRYAINGQEFWDNNNAINFQVNFRRKHMSEDGKIGFQEGASCLVNDQARVKQQRASGGWRGPVHKSLDASGGGPKASKFDQHAHIHLDESGRHRLNAGSTTNLASDNIAETLTSPCGATFSDRYDLGASLIDATLLAKLGRNNRPQYMKSDVRFGSSLDVPFAADPSR